MPDTSHKVQHQLPPPSDCTSVPCTTALSLCLSSGPKAVESSFFPREGTSPSPPSHLRMAYFGFGLSSLMGVTHASGLSSLACVW